MTTMITLDDVLADLRTHATGIDLVADERDGGVCAIPCKFLEPTHTLQESDVTEVGMARGVGTP